MTILNLAITVENDDGHDTGSAWVPRSGNYASDEFFFLRKSPSNDFQGGVRFLNVTIPNAATINSATLTLKNRGSASLFDSVTLFGDDVDDAPAWGASSRPQSGFTDTSASYVQTTVPTGSTDTWTIDATTIVQELVDRGGWASGNDMRFKLVPAATYAVMRITDHQITPTDTTADVAQLDIDYTAGGAVGRIMSSLAAAGGLAGMGGIAGQGGGLAA